LVEIKEWRIEMDMNRKMISDLVIMIGLVLVVIGWSGRGSGGLGSIISYLILVIGAALGMWGFFRYASGHHQPKE
jgi:hypothetical protein